MVGKEEDRKGPGMHIHIMFLLHSWRFPVWGSKNSIPFTVEARKLEYDCPPTPKQKGKREDQPKSPKAHGPTFWSLL